jgi:hypothetical protein
MVTGLSATIVSLSEWRVQKGANQIEGKPTQKDIATSSTRKIIFEEIPDLPISHSYHALNELVIGYLPMSYSEPCRGRFYQDGWWLESRFEECLNAVAPSFESISSLHVKLCIEYSEDATHDELIALFHCFETAIPCTYEATNVDYDDAMTIYTAYDMQCVIHLTDGFGMFPKQRVRRIAPLANGFGMFPEHKASRIAKHIDQCFDEEDLATPNGQLFICDIPSFVLNTQELASAVDVNEAAIIKICNLVSVFPNLDGSIYKTKLDFFKSRIKLVKSGFKPSLADLYPRPQPKSVISPFYSEVS